MIKIIFVVYTVSVYDSVLFQVTFPQVSAMIGNGSYEYDHANDGKKYAIGSCSASFRNQEHDTVIAIRYAREKLTVRDRLIYISLAYTF